MAIRFLHLYDADADPRRVADVQRIFRSYYGEAYGDYADRMPDLLRRQGELGHRTIIIVAEDERGRVLGFALAFHYSDIQSTLLDFLVVDPTVRQRGIGGAVYEALREYLERLGSRGLYLEVRPDTPELEPDAQRRRENRARIRLYERFGARVIAGTAHRERDRAAGVADAGRAGRRLRHARDRPERAAVPERIAARCVRTAARTARDRLNRPPWEPGGRSDRASGQRAARYHSKVHRHGEQLASRLAPREVMRCRL